MELPPDTPPPPGRPRPRASVRSFKSFLVELVIVTAGVLIALSVESLREWHMFRRQVLALGGDLLVEDPLARQLSELYAGALK